MPYEGEFAKYKSVRRIVESERIKNLLSKCEIRLPIDGHNKEDFSSLITKLKPSDRSPKWIIAVDGSKQEIPIRNGFPGAEVAYITVASVMLNVEKMKELDAVRPVDPKEFRKIEQADSIDCAFPSSNVILKGEVSAKSSLRSALFETLSSARMADDGETLLNTFEALLEFRTNINQSCPFDDCKEKNQQCKIEKGKRNCSCDLKRMLYSTDVLRIHEGMNPAGSNGAMFEEVLQVIERLWIVHILRTIEQKGWMSCLKRIAFFLDGPLAVFGHPAWLSEAIYKELCRINQIAKKINDEDILFVGIEKSGFFLEHFEDLDCFPDGRKNKISNQSTILLTDDYIKKNIIFSDSDKFYGQQTYFGRKFFYKNKSGALIVATLPFLDEKHKDLSIATDSQFPRIEDALNLLDELASSRYPNALIPIISAHAEAAIPMNLGTKILERLARGLLDG